MKLINKLVSNGCGGMNSGGRYQLGGHTHRDAYTTFTCFHSNADESSRFINGRVRVASTTVVGDLKLNIRRKKN